MAQLTMVELPPLKVMSSYVMEQSIFKLGQINLSYQGMFYKTADRIANKEDSDQTDLCPLFS